MALYPDYVTDSQLKAHLRITDTVDDAAVALVITAASRAIDKATNRQFGNPGDTPLTRHTQWTGEWIHGRRAVRVFDLYADELTTVKLDQGQDGAYEITLVSGTDFDLWPLNAEFDGVPYTHLVFRPDAQAFPVGFLAELMIESERWGWSAVPAVVQNACLIQAARFFVRRDSQYGVAGSPEAGTELRLQDRLDPDVAVSLSAVRRHWGAV